LTLDGRARKLLWEDDACAYLIANLPRSMKQTLLDTGSPNVFLSKRTKLRKLALGRVMWRRYTHITKDFLKESQ
jgi:hypothetical protein